MCQLGDTHAAVAEDQASLVKECPFPQEQKKKNFHLVKKTEFVFKFPLLVFEGIGFTTGNICFICFPGDLSKWRRGLPEMEISRVEIPPSQSHV